MHYSIDCYVAKALLPVKYQITSTQAIHAWHVAKTRFVTLLSTKVLNRLRNIVMVAEKSFSRGSTTQQSHLSHQHAATLVVAVTG